MSHRLQLEPMAVVGLAQLPAAFRSLRFDLHPMAAVRRLFEPAEPVGWPGWLSSGLDSASVALPAPDSGLKAMVTLPDCRLPCIRESFGLQVLPLADSTQF
jgi:hypothetical protein